MDQTEDGVAPLEVSTLGIADRQWWWCERTRSRLIETSVRTMLVVLEFVLGQDSFERSTTEVQHPSKRSRRAVPTEQVAAALTAHRILAGSAWRAWGIRV